MDVDRHGLFDHNETFNYEDYQYTDPDCQSKTALAVFPLLYTVGIFWGMLGNGLVLAVLWKKRLSWSVMDIFILHLCLIDSLLVPTLSLWVVDAVRGWIMGNGLCKLARALFKINFYSGLFILTCFTGDCYLSIVHGVQKLSRRKPLVVHGSCLIIWLLSLLLSTPDWIFLSSKEEQCDYSYPPDSWRLASRLPHHVCFLLATLVLLFCCSSILMKLWGSSKCKERKIGQRPTIIAALVVFFFIFWTPYSITFIVNTAQVNRASVSECERSPWTASKITAFFGLFHCVVNPVIYLCLSKTFRQQVLTMLKFRDTEKNRKEFSLWDSCGEIGNASLHEEQGPLQALSDISPTVETQGQEV
ncbi:hypothetical protein DNTS_018369 [Danionella cerebrum]|uniref:G-protein coupled receptors family 1 profile domain-containing protein n=1 Tax=Danionella cerebrum TaxID=2873325 RepID=A0A553R048_9TELE|nr:hypothetical protein DNTS_018369 [Danionella translucida]